MNCTYAPDHIGIDIGGKLKETGFDYWNSPNTGTTNESGFSALDSEYRYNCGFTYINNYSHFYTSTYVINLGVYTHRINYNAQDDYYQFDNLLDSGQPCHYLKD